MLEHFDLADFPDLQGRDEIKTYGTFTPPVGAFLAQQTGADAVIGHGNHCAWGHAGIYSMNVEGPCRVPPNN